MNTAIIRDLGIIHTGSISNYSLISLVKRGDWQLPHCTQPVHKNISYYQVILLDYLVRNPFSRESDSHLIGFLLILKETTIQIIFYEIGLLHAYLWEKQPTTIYC